MAQPPLRSETTTIPEEPLGDLLIGGDEAGLDADAMRSRLAARMFGVDSAPVTVGRFELLERLGAGGMGIVCAAFDPALGRKVALKVLSPERDGEADRGRLLQEAKTLARLSHPNVVTVHEVGELDEDIFIVMEYVHGTTLEHWQRERRPLREILRVYGQAAAGLAAAHAVHVVHRDFKPSNALLGADGRVRVVDFGLARGSRGFELGTVQETLTSSGGTPAYMSPEQAAGRGVDQRSDQFSFCVALWEAVHGVRPYDTAAVLSLGKNPARRIEPDTGRRRSPAWLRRVLLRGLSPDPDARWPSMERLREVLASGAGRQRRIMVGAAVVVGLASIAVAAQTAPPPCPSPEARFVGIWDAPRREAVERAILETELPFAEASWRSASARLDDYVERWKQAHVDQCVAERAQGQPARAPAAAACLARRHDAFTSVVELLSLGDRDVVVAATTLAASLPRIEDCAHDERMLHDGHALDPDRFVSLTEVMGSIEHARQLLSIGRMREAETVAKAALERAEALGDPPTIAAALLTRGNVHQAKREVAEAETTLLAAALAAETDRHDRIAAEAWRALLVVGVRDLADAARSTTWAGLAEVALKRAGDQPADRAQLLLALGQLEELRGDDARAHERYAEALALQEDALGPHYAPIATTLRHLANSLAALGDASTALDTYERAREIVVAVHGPGHPDTAILDLNVAITLASTDLEAAIEHAEAALETSTRVYGTNGLHTGKAQLLLAHLSSATGDLERAEQLARQAASILERELPLGHAERTGPLGVLANITLALDRWEEALEIHEALLEASSTGPNRAQLPQMRQSIGWLLCRLDRCEEARPFYERVLVDAPHGSTLSLQAQVGLAEVDLVQGLATVARLRIVHLLEETEPLAEDMPELLAEACFILARALVATGGDLASALEHAERARELYAAHELRPSIRAQIEAFIARHRA